MKRMEIVYNKLIPFKGFSAINLFGKIYRRNEYKGIPISRRILNHEGIHECQSEDFIKNSNNTSFKRILGYLIFYFIYIMEWLIKLICNIFYWKVQAYRSISFEQEAYNNEYNYKYQDTRKRFAWAKYIFKFVLKK